jgi:hypothetical protein
MLALLLLLVLLLALQLQCPAAALGGSFSINASQLGHLQISNTQGGMVLCTFLFLYRPRAYMPSRSNKERSAPSTGAVVKPI